MAQSWQVGTQKLFTSPDSTKVGVGITTPTELLHINKGALRIGNTTLAADRAVNLLKFGDGSYVQIGEWEADDMLSFKANKYNFNTGNVGIGISAPLYKLDVNGSMFLRNVSTVNGWMNSFIYYGGHSLVIGSPLGFYTHNSLDLKPGGEDNHTDTLSSQLRMYCAPNTTTHIERIHFNTNGHCWMQNTGNFGIGTTDPLYTLDVRGTIRADEVIVNTLGADFVFDESYDLRPLEEVNAYIEENKHLPEIQSAAEMQANGVSLDKICIQLLQKIEELTLYIIQQEKRIQKLENQQNSQNQK